MPSVSFDNGTFPLEDVQENPGRYMKRLERAKVSPGYALCLCVHRQPPLKLVIRRCGSLLILAGWPEDGHRHKRGFCPFYKDPADLRTNGGGDSKAAIMATSTGLNVKLDASLTLRVPTSGSRSTPSQQNSGTSRRSASLLAFLQALWAEAALNQWTGIASARHWGQCNSMLLAGAGNALINGADAEKVLHIMRRFDEADRVTINAEFDAFISRLATTDTGATHRGLVIGELNEVQPTQYGHALTLRQSSRKYYASSTLIVHASRKFPFAWRALGDRASRIVAILLVERTSKGHLKLIDLAAMLCSPAFIPCDSSHEVAMASRLVVEHRSFVKPMRMGDADDMLPDFILRDTHPETEIEVYGMNGVDAYEARKRQKQELRAARQIPTVEWDVDRQPLAAVALPPPQATA